MIFTIFSVKVMTMNPEITKNLDSWEFKARDPKILGMKFRDSEKPRFPETLGYPVKKKLSPLNFRISGFLVLGFVATIDFLIFTFGFFQVSAA